MKTYYVAMFNADAESGTLVSKEQAEIIKDDYDNTCVSVKEMVLLSDHNAVQGTWATAKAENENAMMAQQSLLAGGVDIATPITIGCHVESLACGGQGKYLLTITVRLEMERGNGQRVEISLTEQEARQFTPGKAITLRLWQQK